MTSSASEKVALKWVLTLHSGTSCDERVDDGRFPVMGAAGAIGRTNRANTKADSIIIGRVGTVGAVNRVRTDCWASDNTIVATPGPNLTSPYAFYLLLGARLPELASKTAQPLLTASSIGNQRLRLPGLEEQRRIANFLDAETARIDKLANLRERQISLLRERLMATWAQVINDDARDSTWSPIRRFITAITDGPFGSALTSSHYSEDGARVIRLGNLGQAEFRNHDSAYIPLHYFSGLRRHEALPGDLLVAGLGDQNHPLGRACVVPYGLGPAMVKADCFRLRLDQRQVLHEYAAWALSSPPVTDQVTLLARGSTRARINLEVARDIPLPVPSIERQRRSIAVLRETRSAMNSIVSLCRRQVTLLTERRQALITAAVTGQFDVTTASGRNVTEGVTV